MLFIDSNHPPCFLSATGKDVASRSSKSFQAVSWQVAIGVAMWYSNNKELMSRSDMNKRNLPVAWSEQSASNNFSSLTPYHNLGVLFKHMFLLVCTSEDCKPVTTQSSVIASKCICTDLLISYDPQIYYFTSQWGLLLHTWKHWMSSSIWVVNSPLRDMLFTES